MNRATGLSRGNVMFKRILLGVGAAVWMSVAMAADVKISAEPAMSALGGTEIFLGNQSGVTGTATAAQIATYVMAAPPAAGFGSTTPRPVAATTISASSTVSGTGFSTYLASPPAIGATAPAAGTFTSVTLPSATGLQIPVTQWSTGIPYGIPPSGSFPNLGASHTAIYVIGQNPASAGTLSVSATSGSVTATFSAATLLGTASDVGRVISISDTTIKICTITAQSSTTVATCTLGATLSGTGPFANASVWITGTPTTGTASYSTPLPAAFANAYFYFPANVITGANAAGSYYAQCTSIAVCQIFGGIVGTTNPLLAATAFPGNQSSPTNFSITGAGNFTQSNTGVLLFSVAIPANSMGPNGSMTVETLAARVNNANTISFQYRWGGTGIGQLSNASVIWYGYKRIVRNMDSNSVQVMYPNGASATDDIGTSTSAPTFLALDTTTVLSIQPLFSNTTSALDWEFALSTTVTTQYSP